MDFEFDWTTFSGQLPLFPLPNVVQFPHTVLPLHIFEKRYRTMLKNAIEGEKLIGMTVLKPGWEESYSGNPPIYPIACLGRIVKQETLGDGRSNILLYGLHRVRVLDILTPRPYRVARVELLEDTEEGMTDSEIKTSREQLLSLYGEFVIDFADEGQNYPTLSDAELPLGPLADAIAATIGLPTDQQVKLLEEIRVGVRCKFVIDSLMSMLNKKPDKPGASIISGTSPSKPGFPHIHLN